MKRLPATLTGVALVSMTALSLTALVWNPFERAKAPRRAQTGKWIQILEEDSTTRLVRHSGGETRVPTNPQRICALGFADELLTLGIRPVAVPADWRGKTVDYLAPLLNGVATIPEGYGSWLPSFEAVADSKPDLILVAATDAHDYQQLSSIAPTVVLRDAQTALHENAHIEPLKRRLRDLALILGRTADAERAIADFDQHAALARASVAGKMQGKTIAFFRTREREWRLYGRLGDNGAQAIYDALDVQAPKLVGAEGLTALDPESLTGFDADYLIVVGDETPGAHQTLNRLRRNPLWQRVTAIRENHILELTTYRHWIASGLLGKRRMIDEFVQCIRGGTT